MNERRFNLIDEAWIPVAGKGLVSIHQIFKDTDTTALGGNPVEKIAVFKLLLAIAQSAYTPKDEADWKKLGVKGLQKKVLTYLDNQHDNFWLYGDKPFLQMPAIRKAELKSFGDVQMTVATGNTTVVTQIQNERKLTDAEKALIVLTLMGFAFGGKKTDNSIVLTKLYTQKTNDKGKPATGKPGPSLAFMGLLHSFVFGKTIIESVYFNIFSDRFLADIKMYPNGIGTAPWDKMPLGESDTIARGLQSSYIGRLIPLSRFVLLKEDGVHYSEGIHHPGYLDNVIDPSGTADFSAKPKTKVLWTDPEKRPWRQLPSLLSFMGSTQSFTCFQLKVAFERLKYINSFSVWSGGVKVSSNAGEQFLTGTDDFVESEVQLSSKIFSDCSNFFANLTIEMDNMDHIASKFLFGAVMRYYNDLKLDAKNIAGKATNLYWQLCENKFQTLVTACEDGSGKACEEMRPVFYGFALQVYDRMCPNQSARQMESWAKNRPFNSTNNKEKEA